jgi:phosphoribosyl 1,2-cyclic phosphate phosphodiesterase
LQVYGGEHIPNGLRRYAWEKNAELTRNLRFTLVQPNTPFEVPGGYTVTAYPTEHMLDEECYVYLIEKDGKSYFHCHDSGEPYDWVLEDMAKKGVKLDAVCFDGTYGMIEINYGGHMNLNQNILVKSKMEKLGLIDENTLVYITHIAHCGGDTDEIEKKANAHGILVAYDGLEVEI